MSDLWNVNDVALLELDAPLDLTKEGVAAIELNTNPDCPQGGQACVVMGWGTTANGQYLFFSTIFTVTRFFLMISISFDVKGFGGH